MALIYYLLVCFSLLGFVYALTWFFGVYVPSRRERRRERLRNSRYIPNYFIDLIDQELKRELYLKRHTKQRRDTWLP